MSHAIISIVRFAPLAALAISLTVASLAVRPAWADNGCAPGQPCGPAAVDWLTLPGPYSHHPETGVRVAQYREPPAPAAPVDPTFRSSGYTHVRSTLAYGQSADNYHRVERWGDPVRPYGEWRFPYRPFSTPYPNWGPPYAGFNLGFGFPYAYGQRPYAGAGFRPGPGNGPGGGDGGDPPAGPQPHPGDGSGWPGPHVPGAGRHFVPPPPPASPFNPYPAGPGSPYPVAPYYDGYYPVYRD